MGLFDRRLFTATTVVEFPLEYAVEQEGSRLDVTIDNKTGATLRVCFVVSGSLAYPIGDVRAGARETRTFGLMDGKELRSAESRLRFMADPRKAEVWARFFEGSGSEGEVLAGWLDEPAEARFKGRSLSLVTVEPR